MTTATRTQARQSTTVLSAPHALTDVTVAFLDPTTAADSGRLEHALAGHEEHATWRPGPGRVELFRYRDLAIRVASGAAVRDHDAETTLACHFSVRLECPEPFYERQIVPASAPAEVFSAIVVNRMEPRYRERVAALFAGLDDTDFPATMGTRSRRLYSVAPDVYLHVQEFTQDDGLAVIDEAWRDSDPRFLQICADLTPIVPAYDETCTAHEDHIAQRFYVRIVR